jgi:hypothetical protein
MLERESEVIKEKICVSNLKLAPGPEEIGVAQGRDYDFQEFKREG